MFAEMTAPPNFFCSLG